jgi:hypothetical protein
MDRGATPLMPELASPLRQQPDTAQSSICGAGERAPSPPRVEYFDIFSLPGESDVTSQVAWLNSSDAHNVADFDAQLVAASPAAQQDTRRSS